MKILSNIPGNFAVFAVAVLLGTTGSVAVAAPLFGVTGDGANTNPESFFSVDIGTAGVGLIQALGNGNDGESIAYRSVDGLMYHWSGFGGAGQIMETINLNDQTVTNITQDFSNYDPTEVFGSTYDATNDIFLTTDINGNLGSVTAGGIWDLIGNIALTGGRGIAFNSGALYIGDRFTNILDNINPLTGSTNSSIGVTLAGFTVAGINALSTDLDTGILYGILKAGGGGSRRLATINPLTGVATDIGVLPQGFANIEFGAASLVPEPAALTLFGLGLFGLGAIRRRNRKAV